MAFDVEAARDYQRRRRLERATRIEELRQRAENDTAKIIDMLVREFRPTSVYRWGSLLSPERFREWSDIDIAVEGLKDPLDGLRAAERASSLTSFPVDLVELDRIDPRHAETIRNEGACVYAAP